MNPLEIFANFEKNQAYLDWKVNNSSSFLAHFFAQIGPNLELKSTWDVGFYCPEDDKIYIFNEDFELKNSDEVFKKPGEEVEELKIDEVKIDLSKAKQWFKENSQEKFPNEMFGDGFLILQKYQGNLVWNFTLVTKTVKFANMKIDAKTGNIVDVQLITMIDK